jgi:predicted nucleotidyltransferase
MKRIESIQLANEVAQTLKFSISERFCGCFQKNKPVKIYDYLVFGSTARKCDSETVGDLDMLIIDNGQISQYFEYGSEIDDCYSILSNNLKNVILEMIGYNSPEINYRASDFFRKLYDEDLSVDLHILPLRFFKDKQYRAEVSAKHGDPNFFKNCFSSILRFRNGEQFVPVGVSYFEHKYKCDLRDIKK